MGTLQAVGGALEVKAGLALCSTGVGAIIGVPLMAHGAANFAQGAGEIYYAAKGIDKKAPNFMEEAYKGVGYKLGGEKGAAIAQKVFIVTDIALGFVAAGAQATGLADKLKNAKGVSGQLGVIKEVFKSSKVITGSQKQLSLLKEKGVPNYLSSSAKNLANGAVSKVQSIKQSVVSIPQKVSDTVSKYAHKGKEIIKPSGASSQLASYPQKVVNLSKDAMGEVVSETGSLKMNLQYFSEKKVDKIDDLANVGAKELGLKVSPLIEGGSEVITAPQKVIGHYPEYVELSTKLNTKPFSVPDNIWNKMTLAEQWAANQKFLDRAIFKGTEFNLATPIDKIRQGSYLQEEIEYLMSQGYRLSSDGTKLIK